MWAIISIIAALAAARTILIEINYTAYAAVMTPLVILLLDFGQDQPWAAIIDRLVANTRRLCFGLDAWIPDVVRDLPTDVCNFGV